MNKFMKKIMSKKDGFTLVELIVVIAILAILAGVAVPVYSGYIKSANEAADQQKLEAIETAMSAALAMEGEDSSEAASYFTASFSNGVLTIAKNSAANGPTNVDDVWENFGDFYGTTYTVSLQYHTAASTIPALLGVVAVG